jgi:hypothetical protein
MLLFISKYLLQFILQRKNIEEYKRDQTEENKYI